MSKRRIVIGAVVLAIAAVGALSVLTLRRMHRQRVYSELRSVTTDLQLLQEKLGELRESTGRYPGADDLVGAPANMRSPYGTCHVTPRNPSQTVTRIAPQLRRFFVGGRVPTNDGRGREFLYAVSADRQHYILMAVGTDGRVNAIERFGPWRREETWRDVVSCDGAIVSFPAGVSVAEGSRQDP